MRAGESGGGVAARKALLVAATAVLAVAAVLGFLYVSGVTASQSRQEEVAERGAEVMPFDLEETTHVFEKTQTGGVQEVLADHPNDAEQVALIRGHLKEEAAAFRQGDLSDPSEIHGEEMPGLEELEAGAEEMDIRYLDLPGGAKIEYESGESRPGRGATRLVRRPGLGPRKPRRRRGFGQRISLIYLQTR